MYNNWQMLIIIVDDKKKKKKKKRKDFSSLFSELKKKNKCYKMLSKSKV